jgi:hypothetical protein
MRLRSAAVSLGLARRSSGAAKAWVALARQASSSCGYTPFSRHQALRVDSSMAVVVITALSRAAADHARSRAGMVSDSDRHRSRVSTDTPISTEISSKEAVFGGSSLASTLFLKACPYRAIASFHHRPPFFEIYGGDNYSDAGGWRQWLHSSTSSCSAYMLLVDMLCLTHKIPDRLEKFTTFYEIRMNIQHH